MAAPSHQLVPETVDYTLGLEATGPQRTGRFLGKRETLGRIPDFPAKQTFLSKNGLRSG